MGKSTAEDSSDLLRYFVLRKLYVWICRPELNVFDLGNDEVVEVILVKIVPLAAP